MKNLLASINLAKANSNKINLTRPKGRVKGRVKGRAKAFKQ
jgi:hypothetical protein